MEAARSPSPDGFQANLHVVDNPGFAGSDPASLVEEAEVSGDHALLIIADTRTMIEAEMPLLCVDPVPLGGRFRVVPAHLWSVENNVSIASMDFAEFATAVDADGVFRGFRDQG